MGGTAMGTITKYILSVTAGFIAGALLTVLFFHYHNRPSEKEVTHSVVIDTLSYYTPVPQYSYVVRYDTVNLPAVRDTLIQKMIYHDTIRRDSVNVVVPITQKKYEDSTYTAWISGYNPQLDSLRIYKKTIYKNQKERPFGIGIIGGYGYGLKGFSPFWGVGIYYKIF